MIVSDRHKSAEASLPEVKVKKRRSTLLSNKLTAFSTQNTQKCNKCNNSLPYNEDIVSFKGKLFHQKCFQCATCNCTFSKTSTYYEKKGQVYCEKDFFGKKDESTYKTGNCYGCMKPLGEGKFVEIHNLYWHINCFQCTTCCRKFHNLKSCLWIDQHPFCDGCGRKAFVDFYSKRRNKI